MQTNFVLLCLYLLIKGGYCIQFFIQCPYLACQMDFSNQNPVHLLNKSCITISSWSLDKIYFDYHISQEVTFTSDNGLGPYSIIELKGSPFSLPAQTIATYNSTLTERIEEFAVDWIHNTTYILMADVVTSGPIMKTDKALPLNVFLTREGISSFIGVQLSVFNDLKLDPYKGFLFISMTTADYYNPFIIVRSNLSGRSVMKLVSNKYYFVYYLDVSDQTIYVSTEENIYVYNYEGELLKEFHLSFPVFHFAVFENKLYMTMPKKSWSYSISKNEENNIFELALNQTKSTLEMKNVYPLNTMKECYIKVADARVNKQKKNGKFICDRTDCPELCEVESTGDTCVCHHTKAKARDGVTCYDCGQSSLTSLVQEPTIVNGQVSYSSNFPWQAVIYKISNLEQVCGGTLISSRVVLTAAHCVALRCQACIPSIIKPVELKVALGKTKRSWNISELYDVRRNVKKIIVKDGYMGSSTNYENDIALVVMDSEVSINTHVMPACLDYNLNQLPSYETLTSYVSGFGYTKDCVLPCSNYSNTLLYTTGTPMNLSDCFSAMFKKDHATFHRLTADKFCMGDGTASAVQKGDSGGGLTSVYRGLHYLTGVVSVKLIKQDTNAVLKYSFAAFTNVSMHMDWLRQNIMEE